MFKQSYVVIDVKTAIEVTVSIKANEVNSVCGL